MLRPYGRQMRTAYGDFECTRVPIRREARARLNAGQPPPAVGPLAVFLQDRLR